MLRNRTTTVCLATSILYLLAVNTGIGQETSPSTDLSSSTADHSTTTVDWQADYRQAMTRAKAESKMLLVWFADDHDAANNEAFERNVVASKPVAARLGNFVTVKLPLGFTVVENGQPVALLRHAAFAELLGRPGLAIIDQRDPQSPHFGRVVSVYPFTKGPISRDRLAVLLDLPTGTLTQRTMIFAVRTHPLRPQSAWSEKSDLLTTQTQQHSTYQASIRVQGHHRWDQRFHQINARLPADLVANEVCAESWPGQNLVEAAEDCVDCWRQSPGHWDHVRRRHAMFGYDMKRGRNGIWYATGIFASRRQ